MESPELFKKYNDSRHWEQHPELYAESFSEFLKSRNFDGQIIDIGSSTGRDVNVFNEQGFDVVGVDKSEEDIKIAKEKFPELNFVVGDVEELPFDKDSIDASYIINVIHYVDAKKALQEIFRVLKPGGVCFIHFNIDITDIEGNNDYHHGIEDILELVSQFEILQKNEFERIDESPIRHTHQIMELIIQKPLKNE